MKLMSMSSELFVCHLWFMLRPSDRMLDDLEANVDQTDSKLSNAMRRMKKFVRDTEGRSELAW